MHHSNNRSQALKVARAKAVPLRLEAARESRCAVALLALFSFATLSVMATTTTLSRDHADRIAAILHH